MKTSKPTVVILGASYAGLMACSRLLHSKTPLKIVVIDGKSHFEQKIRLHETLTGQHTQTLALKPLLARRGVTFIQAYIQKLDIHHQQIMLKDLPHLSYDYVIYALGSVPQQQIKGSTQFAHSLHNKQQVASLEPNIQMLAKNSGRISVLGSGLTAIETCTELAAIFPNLKISLISRQLQQANLVKKAQRHLDKVLENYGIHRHQGTIQEITKEAVILADEQKIPFDLCLDCTGMMANPVARHSQLAVDEQGRLAVDCYLRLLGTNNVFVAGDAARAEVNGELIRMSCATAMPMGAQAGINVAALINQRALQPFNFGYFARFTSLGRKHAVVQFSDPTDKPTRWVATNYLACLYKEWICKMTVAMIKWELIMGLTLYVWPTSGAESVHQQISNPD
jgi:NADH dehydrogenase FAD-containing subunit